MKKHYVTGQIETAVGKVQQISTVWKRADVWSTIKVRWSVGRMNYRVKQGLYAVGTPDEHSNVFVTGNFKLSFDHVRRALLGMNAWLLVLDTKGINVWCAAGKGTFGTKELVYRIKAHQLDKLVNHRKIMVPQLGAVGVSAFQVKERTGFNVVYGPVRAADINEFVRAGLKANPKMRRVKFPMIDRLKLIPVELAYGKYYLLIIPLLFLILSGFNPNGFSIDLAWKSGSFAVINLFAAYLGGCALTPLFLPWIPFRSFSLKGLFTGWIIAAIFLYFRFLGSGILEVTSWFLIMGAISSFLAMNFTGSSTFTSLSGVQKEMKFSLPAQIIMAGLGLAGWIVTRFI